MLLFERQCRIGNGVERWIICTETTVPEFHRITVALRHGMSVEKRTRGTGRNYGVSHTTTKERDKRTHRAVRLFRRSFEYKRPLVLPIGRHDANAGFEVVDFRICKNGICEFAEGSRTMR